MYTPPSITELGTIADLTQQGLNKVGTTPDAFSDVVPIIGSIVDAS